MNIPSGWVIQYTPCGYPPGTIMVCPPNAEQGMILHPGNPDRTSEILHRLAEEFLKGEK